MPQTGRKVPLVMEPALVDRIDAALGGLSRSEWMRRAAEYVLDNRVKLIPREPEVRGPGCPHPKDKRIQLGYGTVCGVCRVLVS